jgi:hypothetical protein
MAIEPILSRLEKVKATGPLRWSACCPAHGDKTPSLAVREMPDGRVLVHCFGGCSALDVVGAIGLELSDLMPERLDHYLPPVRKPWTDGDALRLLSLESKVVVLALADLADGKPVSDTDLARLIEAAANITRALEPVHGNG